MVDGPWSFIDGVEPMIVDGSNDAIIVDTTYYPYVDLSIEQWKLIAAAPDLLNALKDLSSEVRGTGIFADWPELEEQVKYAIDKAEGK